MTAAPAKDARHGFATRIFGNPYLLLTLTMLFWAGNSIAGRGVRDLIPPFALAWMRWTIAALIVLPFAWPHLKRDFPVIRAHWRILSVLGTLGTGSFVSIYYIGLARTPAINALVINSAAPILIPLATFAFYRERPSLAQVTGIGISFLGVMGVLTHGNSEILLNLTLNEGDLWVLAAMLIWAAYTALLREQPAVHWLSFAALSFVIASAVNIPFFVVESFYHRIHFTETALFAIAYVSTLPSVVAQIFYIRGVALIGSSKAGAFMHFVPMFGILLAVTLLDEPLHLYHIGGFVLILGGVILASRDSS